MTRLFDPERHLPLTSSAWDEGEARAVIAGIARETIAAFDAETLWKAHPLDAPIPDGTGGVYGGAAGIVWALEHLARENAITSVPDFAPAMPRIVRADHAWLGSSPLGAYASLLMGDMGCLLTAGRVDPAELTLQQILGRCAANDVLPVQDLMWGLAGSMLAAVWLYDVTGDARSAQLYRRQAAKMLASLVETDGVILWPFDLYGGPAYYTGLVHGFAGNMLALFKGWHLLTPEQQARAQSVSLATLSATARREDALINWPSDCNLPDGIPQVQICHGAPGILAAFASAPFTTPDFEALLRGGAETIWVAGPLAKGPNFCHGTAGNGHAMLRLYARTGDETWLARARAFAMAAVGQYRAAKAEYGVGRHSLWTGDPGLAVVLWDCITARPRFPSLDCW